jgi:hypothetical protein
VWRGETCDAAVLRVSDDETGDDPLAWLGRLGRNERVPCRAFGFPFAQAKEAGQGA